MSLNTLIRKRKRRTLKETYMSTKASYLDDNLLFGKAFLDNDYSKINEYIDTQVSFTFRKEDNGSVCGYVLTVNKPLSDLYGFPCYVVRFAFKDYLTEHCDRQEGLMWQICQDLHRRINERRGYYTLRVPTHVVDLLRAFNRVFSDYMVCGCTVEEATARETSFNMNEDVKLFYADREYRERNREVLRKLAEESFRNFVGQYHISNVTASKAPLIYGNWIDGLLSGDDRILVAELNGEIAGFFGLRDGETGVEGVLTCVSEKFRGRGIYKSILATVINDSIKEGKIFVSATQLENNHVLRAWASLGMAPYYSFYNIHINHLEKENFL